MTGIFDQSPDADAIGFASVTALLDARDRGENDEQVGPLDTATLHRLAELVDMAATR